MPRGQKFKAEEIIAKLREAEVELARGKKIPEACKQIGVTENSDSHCPPCHTFSIG